MVQDPMRSCIDTRYIFAVVIGKSELLADGAVLFLVWRHQTNSRDSVCEMIA